LAGIAGLIAYGVAVLDDRIETPGGGFVIFQGMQNYTAESVKSFEAFDGAWFEEAQSMSQFSLGLLRPRSSFTDCRREF
jgi:phage terminase large subunit